jgi:peptide/nickel transport system substrate-binding protein
MKALLTGALALALLAAGCDPPASQPGRRVPAATSPALRLDGAATGPARAVAGAKRGGTIHVLTEQPFDYLDPQAAYTPDALVAVTQLVHRSLTGYADAPDGQIRLAGDLATDTGRSSDGGRTWTFTLRDGITFEDGSLITAADVAYGIARAFAPEPGGHGPQYLQNWLQPSRAYRGPYGGAPLVPPGVSVPDEKTLVLRLADPHPELPLIAALPTTSPVPRGKDGGRAYNTGWVSSGPYRLAPGSFRPGTALTLVRNENWDPRSDPIRHQYPDRFVFSLGVSAATQAQRALADEGEDRTAVMADQVPASLVAQAETTARGRTVTGVTPYTHFVAINTRRVTSLPVRRALNLAFDRAGYVKAIGGPALAVPATTMVSPALPGHRPFDAYPGPDPDGARKLLAGARPVLAYCFGDGPAGQAAALAVRAGFERAGFRITLRPVPAASFYPLIGARDTGCDLADAGWGADAPHPVSVLVPLFDGTRIRDGANEDLSYLDDAAVNGRLAELAADPDLARSAAGFGELDERIMREAAPVIPAAHERNFTLTGSRVGGAGLSRVYGRTSLAAVYLR